MDEPQTYGDAPGWNTAQRAENPNDVPEDSSPSDVTADPSPAPESDAPVSESDTPSPTPQATEEDLPFGKHPRWVERQRELEALRAENDRLLSIVHQTTQPREAPPPVQDVWEGKINHHDPATAQYWQEQKRIMEHTAAQVREDALKSLKPLYEQVSQMSLQEFRRANPDVQPGSDTEKQIAAYMTGQVDGMQHTLESAKRNVLFDQRDAELKSLKTKQAGAAKKVRANGTPGSGVPESHGLPRPASDWRSRASTMMKEGKSLQEIANAIA